MKFLSKSKKSSEIVKVINDAIEILESVGIPIDGTERSIERMAMAFLAVANVRQKWTTAEDKRNLKTRDIIDFYNNHFEEDISRGSYDDIRRKDLKLLVLSGVIVNSADNANATRGYSLEFSFMELVKTYGTKKWHFELKKYLAGKILLKDQLARNREIEKIPILLTDGKTFRLSAGSHNVLQKLIIEEFLPRYGKGCQVLYFGDTANKLYFTLKKIN